MTHELAQELVHEWAAAGLLLAYAALCAAVAWRHRRARRRQAAEVAALMPAADAAAPLLVAYASQTGSAEEIARRTAHTLHLAGLPVRLAALDEVRLADLQAARHALFIASTYGEGDGPDNAARFARDLMTRSDIDLRALAVGVLALGDASYANYCGFGRAVDDWLQARGAARLFERIEVDRGDEAAIVRWQHALSHLAGTAGSGGTPLWDSAPFQPWTLAERRHLNPGGQGEAVFHLAFEPPPGLPLPDWQAGDLVQVRHPDDAAPREYTLASLPAEGRLQLMVRQARRDDGSLGLVSAWLTQGLAVGGTVALRLRAHERFRIGANAARPLVLIGNGTGLAGLLAHLKARADAAGPRAWLLYGERQAAHDKHAAAQIDAWLGSGLLAHADRVFSRDQTPAVYVQHALAAQRLRLQQWVDDGAAIYVCGSLQGMAAGIDDVLREVLGSAQVDALIAQGRYRRDVY